MKDADFDSLRVGQKILFKGEIIKINATTIDYKQGKKELFYYEGDTRRRLNWKDVREHIEIYEEPTFTGWVK